MGSRLHRLGTRIEDMEGLDGVAAPLHRALSPVLGTDASRAALGGRWLGHSLHPMLTDFPLGSWTSATLLDLIGGKGARTASRRLIGFGVLTAVPTAAAGANDWLSASPRQRRVGLVHAASNSVALSLYATSYLARRRGRHGLGVATALAGGVVATVGGFLGGHLSMATDAGLRATSAALTGDPTAMDVVDLTASGAAPASAGDPVRT